MLLWWSLGPVPLACASFLLSALGLAGSEGLQVGVLGLAGVAVFALSTWTWFRPRDDRTWVEALRALVLALPFLAPAWLLVHALRRSSPSLGVALDTLTVGPLELSVTGGALLTGTLAALAVRLHAPRDRD
ncbi:MAG: hypothetical protein AB7N76_11885 [Planctomycetota bacterium]